MIAQESIVQRGTPNPSYNSIVTTGLEGSPQTYVRTVPGWY
jgi:hypothetical protein